MDAMQSDKEFIKIEQNRLSNFCRQHSSLYLYGAGTYGRAYLKLLRHMEVEPAGFIITSGVEGTLDGLPVIPLDEVRTRLSGDVGILPAFLGADPEKLYELIHVPVDILDMDAETVGAMLNQAFLPSLLDAFSRKDFSRSLPKEKHWKNILVIRLDMMGDMLMTVPFLRELHRGCSESRITLVTSSMNASWMKSCPYVSNVLTYDFPFQKGINAFCLQEYLPAAESRVRQFVSEMIGEMHYDAVVLPHELLFGDNAFDELLIACLCRADYRLARIHTGNIEQRVLHDVMRNCFSFLDVQVLFEHEVKNMLNFLQHMGIPVLDESLEMWDFPNRDNGAVQLAKEIPEDCVLRIAVGMCGRSGARNWSPSKYAELVCRMRHRYGEKVCFVLFGGNDAVDAGNEVKRQCPDTVSFIGRTNMNQAIALLGHCDMYFGANTGLMHFAAAHGKPVVEISPTLPEGIAAQQINAYHMRAWGVPDVAVFPPKGLDDCRYICLKSYEHCIQQISVEDVMRGINRLLNVLPIGVALK